MERLDKFLCDCGIGTRSQVKAILKAGRVTVEGKWEKDGAKKIDPQSQKICLDGEVLSALGQVVVMLHKPAGFVTATEDQESPLYPKDMSWQVCKQIKEWRTQARQAVNQGFQAWWEPS